MTDSNRNICLVISGFDPSSHAGYSVDVRVLESIDVHPVGVISSLTSQSATRFEGSYPVACNIIKKQLDTLICDYSVSSVKIGMVYSKEIMEVIKKFLVCLNVPIVIDPVIMTTSGGAILKPTDKEYYIAEFLPMATLVTPNLEELPQLLGAPIHSVESACELYFSKFQQSVLVKGGHGNSENKVVDAYYDGKSMYQWEKNRNRAVNTRGSGCRLSSLIAGFLANNCSTLEAIEKAQIEMESFFKEPSLLLDQKFLAV